MYISAKKLNIFLKTPLALFFNMSIIINVE